MVPTVRTTRAGAALVAVLVLASSCAPSDTSSPAPRPTRPAELDSCPEISLTNVPAGFRLSRRRLQALPDNHMGEVVTYRSDRQSLTLYSGPDLYDELEDLDTTAERVETDRLDFTLYSTLLAPELLIAVVDVDKVEGASYVEPCDDAGVLTRWLTREEVAEVLDEVRLARP